MNLRMTMLVLSVAGVAIGSSPAPGQSPAKAKRPVAQSRDNGDADQGTPRLVLSAEEWNFGNKWYGESCSTEITITNVGDAPLKILKIKSSCACAAIRPQRKELLPGESDAMTLTYNTKKDKEQVEQRVTLDTNDPERPRVTIKVRGVVKKIYEAKPASRIQFIKAERNTVATRSVELHNNMDKAVELKLKPFDEPAPFEVTLEAIETGRVYKLSATTRPPLKLGVNSTNIVLETGLEALPPVTIPVSAYIAPRVYVRPARLTVAPEIAKPFQRFVRVSYRSDQPIEITEVKSSHPDLIKVEMLPPRKPANPKVATRVHELRVTLPSGKDCPKTGGQIEIYTNDPSPDYQKLVINVEVKKTKPREIGATRKARARAGSQSEPVDTEETNTADTEQDEPD